MKTFPAVTAPSAAKHTAASQIDLIIFQSQRPLLQGNLRFYWGGCAAEYLSIMAIHRKFSEAADDDPVVAHESSASPEIPKPQICT